MGIKALVNGTLKSSSYQTTTLSHGNQLLLDEISLIFLIKIAHDQIICG